MNGIVFDFFLTFSFLNIFVCTVFCLKSLRPKAVPEKNYPEGVDAVK